MKRNKYDLTMFKARKYLTSEDIIHPFNVRLLKIFLDETGNIKHRIFTGCSKKQQRKIARCIKLSRQLALLTYGN